MYQLKTEKSNKNPENDGVCASFLFNFFTSESGKSVYGFLFVFGVLMIIAPLIDLGSSIISGNDGFMSKGAACGSFAGGIGLTLFSWNALETPLKSEAMGRQNTEETPLIEGNTVPKGLPSS